MSSFSSKSIAAALALVASTANAHMIMKTPTPFSLDKLDNGPITGEASYPCKVSGDPAAWYSRDGIATTMAVGESQTLSFTGSAVHGGGSCQLAITSDLQPSATTSWQVIKSIEGGCPSVSGDGPSEYEFAIPEGVSPGDYTFAWTWISKLAGQPEYYMNCAPITVTGGAAKRNVETPHKCNETAGAADEAFLLPRQNGLPELFVANIAGINDCKTEPGTDPEFPNPGAVVERPNTAASFAKVEGTNCVPKGGSDSGSGSGSGGGNGGDGNGNGNNNGGNNNGGNGNGVYLPSPTSTAVVDEPTSFLTIPIAGPTTTGDAAPAPTAEPTGDDSAPPATTDAPVNPPESGSGSGSGGLSGPCTEEGMFNCDGTSFQQCASGSWTAMQALPGGTSCSTGISADLWARDDSKRSIRSRRRRV
ncbi:hypothetical protein DL764_003170 [Monosporascus ibericus]|uniref:Chitin-binding type-4 domain-containing protein n=1 Tax=Monosporascus ibericus TaxID=155417 RepID=A0A4Q4TK54_9PEZI|nr:hypothetical protein DL764_003170 [Monosporascus ibericus]